jgi:hypothetical protein
MPRLRPAVSGVIVALLIGQGCQLTPMRMATAPSTAGEGLIGQAGSGLVANNAGTLSGTALGPSASLVANNGAGLIANNGGGLIANNGGGLSGRYRTRSADDRLAPAADATVSVTDLAGKALTAAPVTTNAQGEFTLKGLKPSGPIVMLTVRYPIGDRTVTLKALVAAPRQGALTRDVSPASTLVAKKVATAIAGRSLSASALVPATLEALGTTLAPLMSDKAIAIAALTPDAESAKAFDLMVAESPALASAAEAAAPALAGQAPAAGSSATPAPRPSASGTSPTPTPSLSPGASPTASPTPTPTPSAVATPRLIRVAGSDARGYTEATGGDLTTARFNEFAGMAFDGADKLYVADESGSMVRLINLTARTTERVAGSATALRGFSGDGGPADQAKLSDAHGVAIGPGGRIYVCDKNNQRIRVIGPDRVIDTVAGGGATYGDGPGPSVLLGQTQGIAAGAGGVMFFTMRTIGTAYEAVGRLNADGTVKLLTDKSQITAPGAIAVDKAKGHVYFTNNQTVKVLRNAYGTPGAPVDVFTAPSAGSPTEVRGLAFDGAGTLYALASDYDAVASSYGHVNAKLYRVPIGPDGLAAGAAVAIAGKGGSSANPSDYSIPTTGVLDPLTQLLSGGGSGMLEMGPSGTLFIGHTIKVTGTPTGLVQWTQILQLKP